MWFKGETTTFAEYFNPIEQTAIQNDRHFQNTGGRQEPFSDAYLSGLPTHKRRKILQSRPSTIVNKFMQDAISKHASKPQADGPPERFSDAFCNYCQTVIRERAQTSTEYDPNRFLGVNDYTLPAVEETDTDNE